MKRRGRKSKTTETNGVSTKEEKDRNGQVSDGEEQEQEERDKKKGRRSKGSTPKYNDNDEDDVANDEEDSEPAEKKRKSGRKSKGGSKHAQDEQNDEDESEAPEKKKKSGKRPSKGVTKYDQDDEKDEEVDDKKKKGTKRSKPADQEDGDDENGEEESQYEVESVLDEKKIRGVKHYLIRWKGYEPESDTWEPESTLNCPELIADFKSKPKKKKVKGPSKKEEEVEDWDENEDFEVDRVLDVYFKKNGQREFLVSWKGYPSSQNSWEPEENMSCKDLIEKFMTKVEEAKNSDTKELRVKRNPTQRFTAMTTESGRRISKRGQGRQRVLYHDAE